MKPSTVAVLAGVAALTAIYLVRSAASAAGQGVAEVVGAMGQAINPTSDKNLAYTGVNAVGGVLVQDEAGPGKNADGSWTFGGWVYDVLHGDRVGMMLTGKPKF